MSIFVNSREYFVREKKMRWAHWLPQQNKKLEIITCDEMYKHRNKK